MNVLKFLGYFRFAFVLLLLSIAGLLILSSVESYESINSVVINRTASEWRFGFDSLVKGEGKEVLFRGDWFPYSIMPGKAFPIGRDEKRDRILGVYVESGTTKANIHCPRDFSFYRVDISSNGVRCNGTNNKASRWLASLPYSAIFIESFGRMLKELFAPTA